MNFRIFAISLLTFFAITGTAFSQQAELNSKIKILQEMLDEENIHGALKLANSIIEDYPQNPVFYFNRGIMNFHLNNYDKAKDDFQRANRLGYAFPEKYFKYYAYHNLVVEEMKKGYYDDEVKLLMKNNYKPIFTRKDSLQGALRKERTCYNVFFYDLWVNVHPKSKAIDGTNTIHFKTMEPTKRIQVDLFSRYAIESIVWNNFNVNYKREHNAIFIDFPETLSPGTEHTIKIAYSGKPRVAPHPPWNGGFVWDKYRFKPYVGVACEHLGASSWWPNKDHLSDKPDSMKITIGAPNKVMAVANGELRKTFAINDKYNAHEWFVNYPINNYNVTFYLGKFSHFNEVYSNSNGSYNIDYYVLKHNLDKAKKYYSKTSDIVEVFESLFGEYPFKKDGIGMVEAPYKGMEHQGAIAIGDDYDKPKYRGYDDYGYNFLLVHETAHEWWGNAVAIGDMADAWINEGFATYAEALLVEKKFDYNEYQKVIAANASRIFNIMPLVGVRNVNDNTFFTGEIYSKGATMLHNLRCCINSDSLFFDIIKGFFAQQVYKTTETQDFIDYVNIKTGENYTPFFNKYLFDERLPVLEYYFTKTPDAIELNYRWTQVENGFKMPFALKTNTNKRQKLMGTTNYQSITLKNTYFFNIQTLKHFDDETPKNSLTYFWTNLVLPKEVVNYYPSGSLKKEEGFQIGDVKNGKWTYYSPKGSIKQETNFSLGKKHGQEVVYDTNGDTAIIRNYKEGILNGNTCFYKDGELITTGQYLNNKPDGHWEFFSNNKLESEGEYVDGKESGTWMIYNPTGQLACKGDFTNGLAIDSTWNYFSDSLKALQIDTVYQSVNTMPQYRFGHQVLLQYIKKQVSSNYDLNTEQTTGRTFISFTVLPTGNLCDFNIEETFNTEYSNAVIKALNETPRWIPGYINNNPVKVKVTYSFTYGI